MFLLLNTLNKNQSINNIVHTPSSLIASTVENNLLMPDNEKASNNDLFNNLSQQQVEHENSSMEASKLSIEPKTNKFNRQSLNLNTTSSASSSSANSPASNKNNLSANTSTSTSSSSTTSSTSSKASNKTTYSNNSLNQTSFVTSPPPPPPPPPPPMVIVPLKPIEFKLHNSPKQNRAPVLPASCTNLAANETSQHSQQTEPQEAKKVLKHNRQLSSAGLTKATSLLLVSASSTSIEKKKPNDQVNQLIKNPSVSSITGLGMNLLNVAQIDDNNFINNTFSFLDELDNNSEDLIDLDQEHQQQQLAQENKLKQQQQQQQQQQQIKKIAISSSNESDLQQVSNKNNEDFENFPWHAIYPIKDKDGDMDCSDDNNKSKQNGRSKTLSTEAELFAVNEPVKHETRLGPKLNSFCSKAKPIAPKLKSSITIGVASGIEALKAINILAGTAASSNSNNDLTDNERHLSKAYSANKKLLQEIKLQQQLKKDQLDKQAKDKEKRPSITRIIKTDSTDRLQSNTSQIK